MIYLQYLTLDLYCLKDNQSPHLDIKSVDIDFECEIVL